MVDTHLKEGTFYTSTGQYDLAISSYSKALKLNPNKVYACNLYYNRGITYKKKGEYDLAISDLTKAIEIGSDKYILNKAYDALGGIYFRNGEYDIAILKYTKAIELRPLANNYYNRGIAYGRKGEYNLALSDFTKAIEIRDSCAKCYCNRAHLYDKTGRISEAIEDYWNCLLYSEDQSTINYVRKRLKELEKPLR